MGRGRAKAKQTKVARDLKYRTHETDFGALAKSCTARPGRSSRPRSTRTPPRLDDYDEWSDYSRTVRVATDRDAVALPGVEPRDRAGPSASPVDAAQPSQIPRSRPTSRMRRSASRSAAIAGGDAVGCGELEAPGGWCRRCRSRAAGPARRRSPRARRRPGSGRRSSRSSRGRRGCRAPSSRFSMPGCASWLLAAPQTIRAREHLDHLVVERAAQGARARRRRAGEATSCVGGRDRGDLRVLVADPVHRRRVHVGDDDAGAVLDQVPDQVPADLADARDADGPARERRRAPQRASAAARMPWKTPYAVSTEESPGATVGDGAAGDEVALAGDVVHVRGVRAHVAGGEVAAVQGLHEAAVGAQQRLGLVACAGRR